MPIAMALLVLEHIPFSFALQLVFVLLLMVVGVLGVMVLFRTFQLLGVYQALAKQRLREASSPVTIALQKTEA